MIIPIAPLPSITQSIFRSTKDKTPWHSFDREVSYFHRGGVALAYTAKKLRTERNCKELSVFVPDFFCNQSLNWLRKESCKISFYPVDLDLKPDWERVNQIAKDDISPDLFVLVHYFGFCNDVKNAVSFCARYNALLLEDAAHVLYPSKTIGNNGSLTLFSPHKLLPIPPLGVLTLTTSNNAISDYNAQFNLQLIDFKWLIKREIQSLLIKMNVNYTVLQTLPKFDDNGDNFNPLSVNDNNCISRLAIKLLSCLIRDFDEISLKRRTYYMHLAHAVNGFSNVTPLMGTCDNETTPYMFAFRTDENITQDLFNLLRARNVPVQTWPDIAPEILANSEQHSNALTLRNTILTLPVHQSLDKRQVEYLGNILHNSINSLSAKLKKATMHYENTIINDFASSQNALGNDKHVVGEGRFQLKLIKKNEWEALAKRCNRINLLQSWEYGEAKRAGKYCMVKRFAIQDQDGKPFGLVQILGVFLPIIGGIARINRGPMLFKDVWSDVPPLKEIEMALDVICLASKNYRWRNFTFVPEFPYMEEIVELLKTKNFQLKSSTPWGSSIISLKNESSVIRSSLHSKWRNLLNKSEKVSLELEIGKTREDLNYLLNKYRLLKQKKNFSGISEKLVLSMSKQNGKTWRLITLFAKKDNNRIGGVLFVGHGDTCTYLIGWNNEAGRRLQSNYFLLWQAILFFKNIGYIWFDLGGLNKDTPDGIAHFKKGLKGEPYNLVGEWGFNAGKRN